MLQLKRADAACKERTDKRAHRAADNHVWFVSKLLQCFQNTNVNKAARPA